MYRLVLWTRQEQTLATGSGGNVTGLEWTQIDLDRRMAWIHLDQAKARRAIPVPLNQEAVAIVHKQLGKHPSHVFSFRGKPITQASTKACYEAFASSQSDRRVRTG